MVQVTEGKRQINFLTSKNSFFARKNIVVKFPIQDKQKIPDNLPLSKMKSHEPIAWIIIYQKDITLSEFAENFKEKLQIEVWKNKKKLNERGLYLSRRGKAYYTPILKREVGTTVDLVFILRFSEDDHFLSNFSWVIKEEKYNIVSWNGKGIRIRHKKWSKPIRDVDNADCSELYIEVPFLSKYRVEETSRKSDFLSYISKDRIYLHPKKDVLICIGPTEE